MNRCAALRYATLSAPLLVSLILAQTPKAPPKKSPPPQDYSFPVAAAQIWTDTGLDLEAGDRVHIYGTVVACEGATPSEKAHLPLPSAPGGALLAKVHAEAGPILASPDAELPILDPSHLYLGINGWHCHGTIPAKVHVNWHKRPEGAR
jgi:hypothetical protein